MADPGFVGVPVPEGEPDCTDRLVFGQPSTLLSYIGKLDNGYTEDDYPDDACPQRYHSTAQIDTFQVNTALNLVGSATLTGVTATFSGLVSAGSFSANSKTFNISHPSPGKEGLRLVHGCLEGPEHGVYFRGRVKNVTEIDLPIYWKDLVDIDSITVILTPIGSRQNVFIKRWDDQKVYLQSDGLPIDCFYQVYGTRKDIDTLEVVQEE